MKLKQDGVKGGGGRRGVRVMRQGLGGMPHATVFRGPQAQEASRVSIRSGDINRFVGAHIIDTTNTTQVKKLAFEVDLHR